MSALTISKPSSALLRSSLGLMAIAALLICVAGFSGALLELVRRWNQQEEYSHGYLIPLVTIWLLWTRRDALRASISQPSLVGPTLILIAILMHITGELSAVWLLSQIGFIIALYGIMLSFGGYSLLKITFIPITYLLFAIPLPYFIDAVLTLRLQLLSSELGVAFIGLFQIPVFLDGNIIDMGTYKLQVVEACSGLRYLYPLLSLSFLAAYLYQARFWQRALIFLSGIPIAIGMNGLRIGLVGILVDRWGSQMAEGALHFFEGWVIFLACAVLLAGEMFLFAHFSDRRLLDVFHAPTFNGSASPKQTAIGVRKLPALTCLIMLCVSGAIIFHISGRPEITPERARFVGFPTRLAQWQGQPSSLDLATEQVLKADDYLLANYSRSDGKVVNFYVSYYASQRKNESPHSPIVCLPGGGWLITRLDRRNLNGVGPDHQFNRVIIQKDSSRELVYYWFDERGRQIADEYWAKWYLLRDSIQKNRTDGALVRLITEISPDESEADADHRLQAFMNVALPRLADFVPSGQTTAVNAASVRSTGQHS